MSDDEIWDEYAWETFLRADDERVDRYMSQLVAYLAEHPVPDPADRVSRARWEAGLRTYLRDQGWNGDALEYPSLFASEEGGPGGVLDEAPAPDDTELFALEALPVYRFAFEIAQFVLSWSDELPGDQKDSALVQFCSHTLQIPANLARGYGLGLEREMLGGNIACAKRALADANAALGFLTELKERPYMDAGVYGTFYERLFELRNEVGLYVQELRRRFDLGID
jgi:hypothetical protein